MGALSKVMRAVAPLRDAMILGDDRRRELWIRSKEVLHRRDVAVRRSAAAGCEAPEWARIDPAVGYRLVAPDRLPGIEQVRANAVEAVERGRKTSAPNKQQLLTGFVDLASVDLQSPLLQFALQPAVLNTVTDYFGFVPVLSMLDVWHSVPKLGTLESSQLFHCDSTDVRTLKVFVYATDVEDESGPLALLDATTSRRIRQQIGYRYGGSERRVSDDDIVRAAGGARPTVATGPAGTTVFADTGLCFHYGSRLREGAKPRTVVMFMFLNPFGIFHTLMGDKVAPLRRLAAPHLKPIQRLALGAS